MAIPSVRLIQSLSVAEINQALRDLQNAAARIQTPPTSTGGVRLVSVTQPKVAALVATLGPNDAGLLISVTDYGHLLVWDGSALGWGPGDSGSGYSALFLVDPVGAGWHLCDGTAGVKYLLKDGSTSTLTLPNSVSNPQYLKAGAAVAAYVGASLPTMGGPSSTTFETSTGGATVASNNHTHTISLAGGDPVAFSVRREWFRQ